MEKSSVVKVIIDLDKAESIKAGRGKWGPTPVLVDLTALSDQQRALLAKCGLDDAGALLLTRQPLGGVPWDVIQRYPAVIEATQESAIAILDAWADALADEEKAEAEREAERAAAAAERLDTARRVVAEWLAAGAPPPENGRLLPDLPLNCGWIADYENAARRRYWYTRMAEEIGDDLAGRAAAAAERNLQERAERREAEKAARAAAEEKAAAERAEIAREWVESCGTPSQRARHARGVLPEQEVIDGLRARAHSGLADLPRYERLNSSALDHADDCYGGESSFEVEDLAEVDAATWAVVEKIERRLGAAGLADAAEVTPRLHAGTCTTCDVITSRTGVRVVITVGPWELGREYGVPDEAAD